MKMWKKLTAITMAVGMMISSAAYAEEAGLPDNLARGYRDLILNVDYGEDVTYVTGHKHPDSDTVSASIAYAYLLKQLGVNAEPVLAGEMNNETKYALDFFGIEAPQIMEDATDKQFVLVDHSAYTHAIDGMKDARIVGVVDHHGVGDVQNTDFINVRSAPIGSTATLVYLTYRECQVPIPQSMAQVMLMGILSDTKNATSNVSEMDRLAYQDLNILSGVEDVDALYKGMEEAAANYDGMSDMDIFMTDYKEYEVAGSTFAASDIKASGEEEMAAMCDRMLSLMEENYDSLGFDMLFVKVSNISGNEAENQTYMAAYPEAAVALLQDCFNNYDGKYFIFKEYQSRKKKIIPALTAALEKMNAMDAADLTDTGEEAAEEEAMEPAA